MARRPLPSPEEAIAILRAKRTKPQRRPPPPAGKSLAPLLKDLENRFGQGPAALQSRWREIVGDTLARRTEPVRIIKGRNGEGGALELRVDGPVASLIQHQAPQITARLDMLLGKGVVTRLRIVQGPVKAAAAPVGQRPRRKPPLDAALEKELADSLAEQPDGGLKQALLKLGRGVLSSNR
ncbi:DUF721 domain-containing protein [Caulobacter segnis]|uniref:DUF721 domain-containing protein n=2 Tax=Caulobacter segnis TaxID=88688 RepID=D5VE47_CAUST|nr:DciA family protein [Caulobacter segnis]ADG08870.1 protein of unknown function DUF721 [Caulobacter segnis ATCC 21756]AVQ00711.1 DUF721 domain-containing protein [Caulobacter segnis]